MKIKNSKFSKALSLVTSITLLLGTVAALPVNAAIETTAEKTVTEDFGTTSNLVYERSDFTTGMEGFMERGDMSEGSTETIYVSEDKKGVFDGAYKLTHASQNGSWITLWCYDSESDKLVYRKKTVFANFMSPYRFTGTDGSNVIGLKEFSGRLYSPNFMKNENAPYIAFNYIDNGNVDMVYPYIEGNSLYFRLRSVRTETLHSSAGDYKRIYKNLDQPSTDKLEPVAATVNGAELKYLNFKVVYEEDGVTVTFSDLSNSVSCTFKDSNIQNSIVSSINTEIDKVDGAVISKKVSDFNKNAASKATQVGFVAGTTEEMYVDDLSLKYVYDKSAEQLANDYRTAHSDILNKNADDITAADTDAYNSAINDYNVLSEEAKALLVTEKAKLDIIAEKLAGGIIDGYMTANADALALTAETVSRDNVALAANALNAFNALDASAQAKVTEKFNTDKGTEYASLADFLKELCNSIYYNTDGALIYDDFSGYTKADGAWGETDYRTIAKRGNKRIKSAEYELTVNMSELTTVDKYPFYYYDADGQYINLKFGYDGTRMFFNNASKVAGGINSNYSWMVGPAFINDTALTGTITLKVRFSYDYTYYSGEKGKMHENQSYEANFIDMNFEYSVPEAGINGSASLISVYPDENATLKTDIFNVGFETSTLPSGSSLKSLAIEYVDETASDEFEAYKDTYTKTVSDVAVSDKENVNAALAVYETLTDEQKTKYQSNYENLLALSAVIKAMEDINAVSTSTPDALTKLEALETATAAYNNSNIAAALAAQYAAVDTTLRPTIDGATIKTSSEPTEQNLRFTATVKAAAEGWYVKEVGVVMLPKDMLNGELTTETDKAVTAKAEYTAEKKAPTNFLAQLSGSALSESRCARDIAARVYVIYTNGTDEYTYYSTNSGNNIIGGTAIRSVYSVARSMAKAIVGTTEYGNVTYNDAIRSTTTSAEIDSIDGKDILGFVSANVNVIKAYVIANQNG